MSTALQKQKNYTQLNKFLSDMFSRLVFDLFRGIKQVIFLCLFLLYSALCAECVLFG